MEMVPNADLSDYARFFAKLLSIDLRSFLFFINTVIRKILKILNSAREAAFRRP